MAGCSGPCWSLWKRADWADHSRRPCTFPRGIPFHLVASKGAHLTSASKLLDSVALMVSAFNRTLRKSGEPYGTSGLVWKISVAWPSPLLPSRSGRTCEQFLYGCSFSTRSEVAFVELAFSKIFDHRPS